MDYQCLMLPTCHNGLRVQLLNLSKCSWFCKDYLCMQSFLPSKSCCTISWIAHRCLYCSVWWELSVLAFQHCEMLCLNIATVHSIFLQDYEKNNCSAPSDVLSCHLLSFHLFFSLIGPGNTIIEYFSFFFVFPAHFWHPLSANQRIMKLFLSSIRCVGAEDESNGWTSRRWTSGLSGVEHAVIICISDN